MAHLETKVLSLNAAEAFVHGNRNARWDGYTIVQWFENPGKFMQRDGRFRRGMPAGRGWGYEARTPISDDGKWRVNVLTR